MVFTMDAGGSEFSQIFLLDPVGNEDAIMLTDGKSRNRSVVWDRTGEWIAYQSTRRNGASNDVWLMNVSNSETARMALASPDGTNWSASDFSPDNSKLYGQGLLIHDYKPTSALIPKGSMESTSIPGRTSVSGTRKPPSDSRHTSAGTG